MSGLSPGAWAFYSANSVALLTLLQQTILTRKRAKQAADNTQNVSNGFAGTVKADLREIKRLALVGIEASTELQRELNHTNDKLEQTNNALVLHLNGHTGGNK